ncbi:adenine phosphoribosyltransferase [Candidatus Aenigmatarchaeota archaeon]
MKLKEFIRDVPDYPKLGIVFRDITPLLKDPKAMEYAINKMVDVCKEREPDVIAGIEARGFIFGSLIASKLKKPFVVIRKKGKLPYRTVEMSYKLEYGTDTIEIHIDAIEKGQKVVIVDDLLATGGTASGAKKLIEAVGGKPSFCFLIELQYLEGRKQLGECDANSLIVYDK